MNIATLLKKIPTAQLVQVAMLMDKREKLTSKAEVRVQKLKAKLEPIQQRLSTLVDQVRTIRDKTRLEAEAIDEKLDKVLDPHDTSGRQAARKALTEMRKQPIGTPIRPKFDKSKKFVGTVVKRGPGRPRKDAEEPLVIRPVKSTKRRQPKFRKQPKHRQPPARMPKKKTQADFLVKVLAREGKPMKLKVLVHEAVKAGAKTNCKFPEWPLHGVLCRDKRFRQVGLGVWALDGRTARHLKAA